MKAAFSPQTCSNHHEHGPLIRDLREVKHVQTCSPFIHPLSLQYFPPYFLLPVPVVIKRVLQSAHRTTYQPAGCLITRSTTPLFQQHQLCTSKFVILADDKGTNQTPAEGSDIYRFREHLDQTLQPDISSMTSVK